MRPPRKGRVIEQKWNFYLCFIFLFILQLLPSSHYLYLNQVRPLQSGASKAICYYRYAVKIKSKYKSYFKFSEALWVKFSIHILH